MISEGSCDRVMMLKIQLYITEMSYILLYTEIENNCFKLYKYFTILLFLKYFYQINAGLVSRKTLLSKTIKRLTNHKHFIINVIKLNILSLHFQLIV